MMGKDCSYRIEDPLGPNILTTSGTGKPKRIPKEDDT